MGVWVLLEKFILILMLDVFWEDVDIFYEVFFFSFSVGFEGKLWENKIKNKKNIFMDLF